MSVRRLVAIGLVLIGLLVVGLILPGLGQTQNAAELPEPPLSAPAVQGATLPLGTGLPLVVRTGLSFWGFFVKRPRLYRLATRIGMRALSLMGRRKGRFSSLPLAGGWTGTRDFAAPQGDTFQARWNARRTS